VAVLMQRNITTVDAGFRESHDIVSTWRQTNSHRAIGWVGFGWVVFVSRTVDPCPCLIHRSHSLVGVAELDQNRVLPSFIFEEK